MPFRLKFLPALKTALRGVFFRPGWYSDNHRKLEQMYRTIEDPWNFETSLYEQERFDFVLEMIRKYPHERILEVGCAEGLFTHRLQEIARTVVAIDVSPTAIGRARERAPLATFVESSLDDFTTDVPFDMVVCMETLYYIRNVKRALAKLSSLGRAALVSYLDRESKNLDEYMMKLPLVEFQRWEKSSGVMRRAMTVAVWKNG